MSANLNANSTVRPRVSVAALIWFSAILKESDCMCTRSLYRQVFERRITVVQFQMKSLGFGLCLISEIPLSLFRLPLLLLYLFLFKWHQLRRTECSNVYGMKHIQTCFFSSNYKIRMAISQSFSQPARKRCASKFRSGWGFFPNPYLDSCSLIPDIFLSFFFLKRSAGNEQSQT